VKFRAGQLEFNATIAEASEIPSPLTGEPLRALTIQFRAQQIPMHELALEEAQHRKSGGLFSFTDTNQPDLEWRVRESASSYVGTDPWGINHHLWRIEQVERLACERLIVADISLEPYDYAESVSNEGIVRLAARAPIGYTDLAALAVLRGPVDVVRQGISDTLRHMTLEYVWGPGVHGLGVALRAEDVREPRVTLANAIDDAQSLLALVALLHANGALDQADLDKLTQHRHASRHVANLDAWSLTE
jgi:hypothetical protein